jgi:hypothetical protein
MAVGHTSAPPWGGTVSDLKDPYNGVANSRVLDVDTIYAKEIVMTKGHISINIEKILTGYIVKIATEEGREFRKYAIADIDELPGIIAADAAATRINTK